MSEVTMLAAGKAVKIDLDVYLKICTYGLSIRTAKCGYKGVIFSSGPHRHESLARYILGLSKGDNKIADHIDRNTFNNLKSNLRIVNATESVRNRSNWGTSNYRGVYKNGKNWASSIMVQGKKIFLGTFLTQELAFTARLQAEKKYWSETE